MAKLLWYVNRLRMMSASEITWRVKMLMIDTIESIVVVLGHQPMPSAAHWPLASGEFPLPEDVVNFPASWKSKLVEQADRISENKLNYFSHEEQFIGNPIAWRKDHSTNVEGPLNLIQFVDYRNHQVFGDCKEVWEPNRHHHLVVLARAFYITKDEKYAEAAVTQLSDWISNNPYGRGMNWRSPLELGIRLINWVWTLKLIEASHALQDTQKQIITIAIYQQCRDIARKFSQGSSANNHLIGEAAGVFIASCYFNEFDESQRWRDSSQKILEEEIFNQTFSDGCTREHALGYQLFVIQFFTASGLIARAKGFDFSEKYWNRLELMFKFVSKVADAGGSLPFFGDRDDGYVLDLGEKCHDINMLIDVYAQLFDHKEVGISSSETSFWLLASEPNRSATSARTTLNSASYPESGYHLLQASDEDQGVSVFIDTADLGYQSIAAHGHADALSITMRLGGEDVFVDSGTFDYFTYPEWRNYFRSTRAHNTVEVDGVDQSEMQGAFMWTDHANCTLIEWLDSEHSTLLKASHDGYQRLADPVTHERHLDLNKEQRSLTISDILTCKDNHVFAAHFHCHPAVTVNQISTKCVELVTHNATIEFTAEAPIQIIHGSESKTSPDLGWFSQGYHQKTTTTVLRIEGEAKGTTKMSFRLSW